MLADSHLQIALGASILALVVGPAFLALSQKSYLIGSLIPSLIATWRSLKGLLMIRWLSSQYFGKLKQDI